MSDTVESLTIEIKRWNKVYDVVKLQMEPAKLEKLIAKIQELKNKKKLLETVTEEVSEEDQIRLLEDNVRDLELERTNLDMRIELAIEELRKLKPYDVSDDTQNNMSSFEEHDDDYDSIQNMMSERRRAAESSSSSYFKVIKK